MPPKPGAMRLTVSTISSGSFVSRQIGKASTPANSLKSIALPSMTGIAASGPMSPRPSTAVPSLTTATVLRLIVYWKAFAGSSCDRRADARDARRVGHREVVARLERRLVVLLDLAADVQQERAVGRVDDARAVERRRSRATIASQWSWSGGVDGDVAQRVLVLDLDEVDRADRRRPRSPIALGHPAEHAGLVVDLDADREGVLGGGGGHGRREHTSRFVRARVPVVADNAPTSSS